MPDFYWAWWDRDLLEVTGPESGTYLQGQLSQDVLALHPGASAWSWLLAPTGKVDALLRVSRLGEDRWLIDTDPGFGDPVRARLDRFKLRTKVVFTPVDGRVVALRGDDWKEHLPAGAEIVISPPWPGWTGADAVFVGEAPVPPDGDALPPDQWRAERVLAGVPAMGSELDERTIPGETGLVGVTVSFTKGCYTGQELVARVDSRGNNVPRRLRLLRLDGPVPDPSEGPVELHDGERVAGQITTVAERGGRRVALGWVKRGYEPPVRLQIGSSGTWAEVAELPL